MSDITANHHASGLAVRPLMHSVISGLGHAVDHVGAFFESFIVSVQAARLSQDLFLASDVELARMGITRADIPSFVYDLTHKG